MALIRRGLFRQKAWANPITLAATNAYGGAVADLENDQAYDYTADIDLEIEGYDGANISIEYTSAGTTDNIILSIFASTDRGTTFDTEERNTAEFDATPGGDRQGSIEVTNLAHFRLGVKTSGTTDKFDYRIIYQPWRELR